MEGKTKKITRGWNLSEENVEFLYERANEMSTSKKRVSASEVLDHIVSARRQIAQAKKAAEEVKK